MWTSAMYNRLQPLHQLPQHPQSFVHLRGRWLPRSATKPYMRQYSYNVRTPLDVAWEMLQEPSWAGTNTSGADLIGSASQTLQRLATSLGPKPEHFPQGPDGDVSLRLLADPLKFLQELRGQYGGTVGLVMGGQRVVLTADPDFARTVLIEQANTVFVKEGTAFFPGSSLAGNGLLVSDGAIWKRQRQLTNPAFRRAALEGYAPAIMDCTQRYLAELQTAKDATRDVYADFNALTLQVVLKTLFGASMEGAAAQQVTDAIETAFGFFARRAATGFITPEWLPTPDNVQYNAAVQRLDEVVYGLIRDRRLQQKQRRAGATGPVADLPMDLLEALLCSVDDRGEGMSDQALRDELMTLLVAGQETSAILLGWAAALLAYHPKQQEQVAQQLQQQLQGRLPELSDLRHLSALECVLLEALRVLPPAYMVGRCAATDTQLGPFQLPKGTTVLVAPYLMHRDPTVWDRPDRFVPQRWQPHLEAITAGGKSALVPSMALFSNMAPNGHYLPFAAGPRNCVGTGFAMMEVMMVLAALLQRYRLAPPNHGAAFPTPAALITLRPGAVNLQLLPRQ